MLRKTTTVIVGAGQSGLAMSAHLSSRAVDHVVLERGEVAGSWMRRWESLRLLTPNWFNRLPGYRYSGDDPDGYMTMPQVTAYVRGFAAAISAPVHPHTEVLAVRSFREGFVVRTADDEWSARTVVLASGPYNRPHVPGFASALPPTVTSLTPDQYRNPSQLPDGGVLVVGAAATGIQLAEEIQRSGRAVTLAVGNHVRTPRMYRGMDIMWWLDAAGVLDEGYGDVDDLVRARNVASFQLLGSEDQRTVDLNALRTLGVRIVGRLAGVTETGIAQFSGSLANVCTLADLKLRRLLDGLDTWARDRGVDAEVGPVRRPAPTVVPPDTPLVLPLRSGEITSVIWATGYRSEYPWLDIPVLDVKGNVRHSEGVTAVPGLYLIGAPFLRRRKSTLIDGAGGDAQALSEHLVGYLDELAPIT